MGRLHPQGLDPQEQRTGQGRPFPGDEPPGRLAVTRVEEDVGPRAQRVVVLPVEPALRPLPHRLGDLAPGPLRVVGRQPDQVRPRPQLGGGVQVAARQGAGQQPRQASGDLAYLAHEREGQEHEAVGARHLPRRARALLAEALLLVLDEPTAHLDPPTAGKLLEDVFAAAGDRCVMLITHRPEGLDLVDEVVVMESPIDRKETR